MTLLVKRDDNPMKVLRECYVVSIAYIHAAGARDADGRGGRVGENLAGLRAGG